MDFIYLRKIFNLNNSTKFKIKIKKIENWMAKIEIRNLLIYINIKLQKKI